MPKVHIQPSLPDGPDPGDGGIRQVVRAQLAALPEFGWEHEPNPALADILLCHAEVPPAYLNRYPTKPLVVMNHGAYWAPDYEWSGEWQYTSNRRGMEAIRAADVVLTVSDWVAQTLRRHSLRDIRVVHHGIDPEEWQPIEEQERAALTPYVLWNKTRVDPVCDPAPLNEVARLLPDVRFVSTFADPAPNVTVLGQRLPYEDSRWYIERASVYLCTVRETFGIGTLEALACGVPVVGYRFGGQEEILTHGHDGWLVREGDVAGLAEGIRWALEHRAEIAPRARATAERFTWRDAARRTDRILREVLERAQEQRPRVSVVVPAYGLADVLPDTLQSVLDQTETNWECIVVDDASPDGCGAIADEWAARDPRFRAIHNEENQYLAESRNIGFREARGRYLIPLDADDLLAPDALATLADALDKDRRIDIAYGGVRFLDTQDGVLVDHTYPGWERDPGHSGWPVPWDLDRQLDGPGQLLPYCSMFRRVVWEQSGGYRGRARSSEDCDFWLRTTSYGFVPRKVTEADTLLYRLRPESMSATIGWEEHRPWYPWVRDRSLLPAGGGLTREVDARGVSYPAFDPPVISVIIPVGPGHERYVQDAVDSLDGQTFRRWECLVVNDSGQPLRGLPNWVRIIEPEEGRFGGVAAARNAGVRASRAPLFLPLDADDILSEPQALQIMLEAHLDSGPCRSVVYPDWWEDPVEPGEWRIYEADDFNVEFLDGRARTHRGQRREGLIHTVTALTPRRYWEQVGGYDEDLPAWEDWAFAIKLGARGICSRRVSAPLFTYRKHTGKRRDENYEDFEGSKAAMLKKDFGLKEGGLMPCSTCGGGQSTFRAMGPPPSREDMVLLEYTGNHGGTMTFRGAQTKTAYRFGGVKREGYVHRQDVAALTARADFRVKEATASVSDEAPVMEATRTSAPARMAVPAAPAPSRAPEAPAPSAVATAPAPAAPAAPPAPERETPEEPEEPAGEIPEAIRTQTNKVLTEFSTRQALNAEAERLGIESPESFANKTEIAKVIAVKREMG